MLSDEGGAWLFPRAMGFDRALKMTWLQDIYDATTAHDLGLVTEVVDDELLEDRTLDLCDALTGKATLAIRLAKMMMAKALDTPLESSMVDAQMAVMIANQSDDPRKGIAAFGARRAPGFEAL